MKKRKNILIAVVLVLVFVLLFPPFWARYRALEYLEEKYNKYVVYGEVIRLEDVKFDRTRANIFTGDYSVQAVYDNVAFEVYSGRDTYTEDYQQKRYTDLLLSGEMDALIGAVSVTIMDRQSGAAVLDRRDVRFALWLNFEKTFATKEEYAAAVRQVLDRLEEAELTRCDQLHTNGYIDGTYMQCSVYPLLGELTDAEILSAVTIEPPGKTFPSEQ